MSELSLERKAALFDQIAGLASPDFGDPDEYFDDPAELGEYVADLIAGLVER